MKIPFISNLKKLAYASKQDVLERETLRYHKKAYIHTFIAVNMSDIYLPKDYSSNYRVIVFLKLIVNCFELELK